MNNLNQIKKYLLLPFMVVFSRSFISEIIHRRSRYFLYMIWVVIYLSLILSVIFAISVNSFKQNQLPYILNQFPSFSITENNEFKLEPSTTPNSNYDQKANEYVVVLNQQNQPIILFNPLDAKVLPDHNPALIQGRTGLYVNIFKNYISVNLGEDNLRINFEQIPAKRGKVYTPDDLKPVFTTMLNVYFPICVFIALVLAFFLIYLQMVLMLYVSGIILESIMYRHIILSSLQMSGAVYAATIPFLLAVIGTLFNFLGELTVGAALNNQYIWMIGLIFLFFGFKDAHKRMYYIGFSLNNKKDLALICKDIIKAEDLFFMNAYERVYFMETGTIPSSYQKRSQFYEPDLQLEMINQEILILFKQLSGKLPNTDEANVYTEIFNDKDPEKVNKILTDIINTAKEMALKDEQEKNSNNDNSSTDANLNATEIDEEKNDDLDDKSANQDKDTSESNFTTNSENNETDKSKADDKKSDNSK